MNLKIFWSVFMSLVVITVVASCVYYSPAGLNLETAHIQHLEKKFAKEGNEYRNYSGEMKLESEAAVAVFGVKKKKDDIYRVYGYEYDSTVVVFNGKYYELSGNNRPFIADMKIPGVGGIYSHKIRKTEFPFGMDSREVKKHFPKPYLVRENLYNYSELAMEVNARLEKKTGVKKDSDRVILIDEEQDKYIIFDRFLGKIEGPLKELEQNNSK